MDTQPIFPSHRREKIKLIALDLDGTLLNSNRSISERTKDTLARVQQQGIYVVLVSGRSYSAVKPIYDQLNLHAPVVCYNGAGVLEGDDGTFIHTILMEDRLTRGVIDIARRYDIHVHVFIEDEFYYEKVRQEAIDYEQHIQVKGNLVPFDEMQDLHVLKALCIADHDILVDVSREIGETFGKNIYRVFSFPHFLEVMDGRVSKVEGLKAVCRQYGIHQKEIIAFGDGENDIEMLRYAGMGVAMDNAYDHVKDAADYVTGSNDEDGICRFLEHLGIS